jgi:hypothetical protein
VTAVSGKGGEHTGGICKAVSSKIHYSASDNRIIRYGDYSGKRSGKRGIEHLSYQDLRISDVFSEFENYYTSARQSARQLNVA